MDRKAELEIVRRAYAKRVMFAAGVHDRRVEAAFASVSREHFLGRGPWSILRWNHGYVARPSGNPVYIYDDVLIGIVPERRLNNVQPSLHALLVASAAPRPGEHAVHIGAGVGYYTAIIAHLVGRRGRVTAIEYDPALAAQLRSPTRAIRNGSRTAMDHRARSCVARPFCRRSRSLRKRARHRRRHDLYWRYADPALGDRRARKGADLPG